MEKIRILHTNDLHSHFENWPKIKRYIQEGQRDQNFDEVLTFDIGDFMDRSHPLTDVTNGQANIHMLNELHCDGITIGNNEGISNSHQVLEHLFDRANFDVILGNLFEKDGKRPSFFKPFKIITTKRGTRIAVLGLTAAYPLSYEPNGWRVELISNVLPILLAKIEGQYDYLILLSHLGINMDRYIAQRFPAINLILGGHTHHLLAHGELDHQTYLAAAEKWGHYIGDIALTLDDQHQSAKITLKTIKTADLPDEPGDQQVIEQLWQQGYDLLASDQIADLPDSVEQDPDFSINTALQAIADFAKTDLAILNTGLLVHRFRSGVLNAAQLQQILPHPMHVVTVKLKGQELWRLIMEMEKNRGFLRQFAIKGMSFRGKIFGDIRYLGITIDQVSRTVYVNHQELDVDRVYKIATVDHYVFIPFFPTIEIMGDTTFLFPKFLRTVVGDYLTKKYPIHQGE